MPAKEFIVAIELGSSKITGIAGKKNLDGSISVLAVVNEDSSACIRKGIIYNLDKTGACLTNIINKLKTTLKTEIKHVYVGVNGQSIRCVKNVLLKELPEDTVITQEMVDGLMDANRSMSYPEQEILYAERQEYKVGSQLQLDPVGIQSTRLEGNFLNILWRQAFYRKLNQCFQNTGIAIGEMYLAPLALADSVLTEAEKRGGCVLVDLGADTTTVAVYHKNILRHLAVIPLGGNNITKDLTSLQIEEADAERMKLKYASAYTENAEIDNTLNYPIDSTRSVESRQFIEIVEARVMEIIENTWYQVPSEFYDKLLGGIILTGGGSNMTNIEKAFRNHTHIDKIRTAKFVTQSINFSNNDLLPHDGTMNTVLGLLAKGDMNCAGEELDQHGNLFGGNKSATSGTTEDLHGRPRSASELGQGVVLTAAEKEKAAEEARLKAEEEARQKEEEEARAEAARRAEEEERRKNNLWNKSISGLKNFLKKITEEDSE